MNELFAQLQEPVTEFDSPDTCKCSNCNLVARWTDCERFQECESWELPTLYWVFTCPLCGTDGMECHGYGIKPRERLENCLIRLGKWSAPWAIPFLDGMVHRLDWLWCKLNLDTWRKQ